MKPILNKITISEKDFDCLTDLLATFRVVDPELIKCQDLLLAKLQTATVLKREALPEKLVQLNSVVTICSAFGRKVGLELVLPLDADFQERKLSVISPLGMALLGVMEGDKSLWYFPNGDELVTVEQVDNTSLNLKPELNSN